MSSSLSLLCWAATVHAGFEADTGRVRPAPSSIAVSLDDVGALDDQRLTPVLFDAHDRRISGDEAAGYFAGADDAIEGAGTLRVGGPVPYLYFYFGTGLRSLEGKRVQITLWQHPRGTRLVGALDWFAGDLSGATDLNARTGGLVLQPTGAVTDDGWEEWTTGPFDYAWAGTLAPLQLALRDAQLDAVRTDLTGGLTFDATLRVDVDAVELAVLGEAAVVPARCTALDERATCGDAGLCHYGICVDAASLVGQPILDRALRGEYLDRRVFELRTFEGGRSPRSRLGVIAGLLDGLRSDASAVQFWPTLNRAFQALLDGHASAPWVTIAAYLDAGVCLHEGEADLLAGAPVTPLVFRVPATANALSSQLRVGDALVLLDGLSVAEWTAANPRLLGHSGDLRGASVVLAPSVLAAAIDAGAVAVFARCPGPIACAAGEEQRITIDLGALARAAFAAGSASDMLSGSTADCDYRFVRPIDDPQNTAYEFAGHIDEDGIRTLVINGVPGTAFGADAWKPAIEAAFSGAPPLLLLDQRTGGGGTYEGVDLILGPLFPADTTIRAADLPPLDDDTNAADRATLLTCGEPGPAAAGYCGNTVVARIGQSGATLHADAANAKLAVLDALDISGNDFLARALRLRTSGQTRIFGAGATYGAYGQIAFLPNYFGEFGGSVQTEDALFLQSADDPSSTFETSTGVVADDGVRQKQSDALLGRDTLLEAARTWLRTP